VRTHVPFIADIRTRTAGARRVPALTLVPSARGRRSRRLGGRPERASRRSSTPSAAARAHSDGNRRSSATRAASAHAATVHLPRGPHGRECPTSAPPRRQAHARVPQPSALHASARELERGAPFSTPHPASLHLVAASPAPTLRCADLAAARGQVKQKTGGVLLSQVLADRVPSALRGLTALFGMGRGVSPSPRPPEKVEKPPLPVLQNCTAPHEHHKNPSSPRPISTGLLRALPPFQIRPINLVVYQGSYSL
jgi:hypothetical protein